MPKISIITPSYNHSRFLQDRVSSILSQTFEEFEWIIIDDCSTDNSAKILKRLTAHDPRVKLYFNKANMGMSATTKKAITLSSGKYIYRAESDDCCHQRFLERMVRVLDDNPNVGFVFCSSLHIDKDGHFWGGWNQKKKDYICQGMEMFKSIVLHNTIPGCNVVFSRKAHDAVGGFGMGQFQVSCDWHFSLRLCLDFDVGYIAEPLGYHRTHDANLSGQIGKTFDPNLFYREGYEMLQDVFALIPEKHIELYKLRDKACRSLSLLGGSSFYVKALLSGRWDIAHQIREGIEHYDQGATHGIVWLRACLRQFIQKGIYHYIYTPLGRVFNIKKKYHSSDAQKI